MRDDGLLDIMCVQCVDCVRLTYPCNSVIISFEEMLNNWTMCATSVRWNMHWLTESQLKTVRAQFRWTVLHMNIIAYSRLIDLALCQTINGTTKEKGLTEWMWRTKEDTNFFCFVMYTIYFLMAEGNKENAVGGKRACRFREQLSIVRIQPWFVCTPNTFRLPRSKQVVF